MVKIIKLKKRSGCNGLCPKCCEELKVLKKDLKENIEIIYNRGEVKPKEIIYFGTKFKREVNE